MISNNTATPLFPNLKKIVAYYAANNTSPKFSSTVNYGSYSVRGNAKFDLESSAYMVFELQPTRFLISQPTSYRYGMES